MGDQITAIKNITNKTKNWKAKVYVLEKWEPRVSRKDSLRYQKLLFSDPEGTRVQATLFEGLIEKFEDTLQIFKSYYISNAGVKFLEQSHRIGSHPWQWTIHGSTLIQLIENEDPVRGLEQYNIVRFSQFPNHVDTQSEINILAAVIKIKPSKIIQTQIGESTAQEIVVINQESLPTILTLWDQFISNEGAKLATIGDSFPIVIGIRLKVTSYCGQSLSTRPKSTFILNPDSPDAHALRSWCIENEDSIRAMSLLRERQSPRNQTPTPKAEQIVQIVAIPSSPDALCERMYWIKATMSIASLNQSFWYMSCSSCFKSIRADYGTIFDCIHCKNKKVVAQPRLSKMCKFMV